MSIGEAIERAAIEPDAVLGRRRRGPQHECGVVGRIAVAGQVQVALPDRQARADRAEVDGRAPPEPGRHPVPRLVGDPGDGAGGVGHGRHEGVGVLVVKVRGDRVLFLQCQTVTGATGLQVQGDPGIDEHRLGGLERPSVTVEQHRLGRTRPVEGVDVTQTAADPP